jgi:hypothetical protein
MLRPAPTARLVLLAGATCSALALAACGSSGDTTTEGRSTAARPATTTAPTTGTVASGRGGSAHLPGVGSDGGRAEGRPLDADKLEAFVVSDMRRSTVHPSIVSCPPDPPSTPGKAFSCRVVGGDGSSGTVTVTPKATYGDVRVDRSFFTIAKLEASLLRNLKKDGSARGASAKVTCPEIMNAEAGAEGECVVTAGKDRARVEVSATGKGYDYTLKR